MKTEISPTVVGRFLFTSLLVLNLGSVNAVARGQLRLVETTTPAMMRNSETGQPEFAPKYLAQRLGVAQKFTALPGVAVRESEGHKLGKLQDAVVDLNSGRVLCALVSHGSTVVAMPGTAFNNVDKTAARLNLNNVNLSAAPHVPSSDLTAVLGSLGESYSYFGGRFNANNTVTARVMKCSELIGANVRNNAGESLGTVVNVMVDLPTERVVYLIVSFTGKDSDLYAVPPMAFQNSGEHSTLVLNIDRSRAETLSQNDGFFWSNLAESAWAINLYHGFGLQADFDADSIHTSAPVGDTAHAESGNTSAIVTQATVKGDRELSKDILMAMMQDNVNNPLIYENVQIKPDHGQVTLSGRVKNQNQRNKLVAIIANVAGAENIRDEMVIK